MQKVLSISIFLLLPFIVFGQTITTVAGGGTIGTYDRYLNDGCLATASGPDQPIGTAVDKK